MCHDGFLMSSISHSVNRATRVQSVRGTEPEILMARLIAALAHTEGRAAFVRLVRHLHREQRSAIVAAVEQAWERGSPLAETHR